MAGVANGETQLAAPARAQEEIPPRPNYSDTLAAVTAVQRQVEALGSDLAGALQLVVERAQTLVHASGAAIAMGTPIRISWFVAPVLVRTRLRSVHVCRWDPVFPGNA